MLDLLEAELASGNRKPENEKQYAKYFEILEIPVRGIETTPKQDSNTQAEKDYGFFTLISNDIKDPIKALESTAIKTWLKRRLAISRKDSI